MINNREISAYKDSSSSNGSKELYSKVVRAGSRTYFFDVKATRGNDPFVTITESRKQLDNMGDAYYEKHKIHLYKEDFEKYLDGLREVIEYIKQTYPDAIESILVPPEQYY